MTSPCTLLKMAHNIKTEEKELLYTFNDENPQEVEVKQEQQEVEVKQEEREEEEEEENGYSCKFCLRSYNGDTVEICDICEMYFCLECLNGEPLPYECDDNDLSYHQFCSRKCRNKWCTRFTFPCDGGCIALLSRRKQPSRYWGNYLERF